MFGATGTSTVKGTLRDGLRFRWVCSDGDLADFSEERERFPRHTPAFAAADVIPAAP